MENRRLPPPYHVDFPHSPTGTAPPNPLFQNQHSQFLPDHTLEDSFALLDISSYNHPPSHHSFSDTVLDGGSIGRGFPVGSMLEESYNQVLAGVGGMRPQNHFVGSLSWGLDNFWSDHYLTPDANECYSNYDHFLSSRFARQQEVGTSFPIVPLSNGHELPLNLQQSQGLFYSTNNYRPYRSNRVINGRCPRWLQPSTSLLSISDLRGSMLLLAKHQPGCQLLRDMMTGLKAEEISLVFSELIGHVRELMLDPFGNYVFQKMLDVCTEEQRTEIILMVTRDRFQLLYISRNMHGSRSVQKLLEHVTSRNQLAMIISALTPAVVQLAKDEHGHHVVLRCLKQCSVEQNRHLLNEVVKHCFELATDKSGCCVLLQCFNHAEGAIKDHLISEILWHVLRLAQDRYGNYVVQHLISLRIAAVTECMLGKLQGYFIHLSCNKFASNVVERFLNESGQRYSELIIHELLQDKYVPMLLVDQYGNYVIKSALNASKGQIRDALLKLIERNLAIMRTNLYGKKLLAQVDKLDLRSA